MNATQPLAEPEKRQHERFSPDFDSYVETAAGSGLISDASLQGLAFTYIARKRRPPESFILDIVSGDETICEKVSFVKIYDHPVPHDSQDKTLIIRRCGIRFTALTDTQQARLSPMLNTHKGK